jgi:rhodanese-related sulfurtransferase
MRAVILIMAVLGASFSSSIWAAIAEPTPLVLEGGRVISAAEARAIMAEGTASVFDTRYPINYGRGHLPSAISLPYKGRSANRVGFNAAVDHIDLSKLPAWKDATVVFYSHGITGWKSYKAAVLAIRAGYRNVLWMRGGIAEWKAKGYPVE